MIFIIAIVIIIIVGVISIVVTVIINIIIKPGRFSFQVVTPSGSKGMENCSH